MVDADLLVIVPTRRRPQLLSRLIESMAVTSQARTALLVVTDDDEAGRYDEVNLRDFAHLLSIPRVVVRDKVNRFAVPFAAEYPALMFVGDDHVCETPGWDRMLLDALDGGIAYPNDGRRADVPECWVVASPVVQALGWLYPPYVAHYWADNIWADIGNGAGCLHYVPGAMLRHLHYHVPGSGAERDQTYADAESHGANDAAAYSKWRNEGGYERDLEIVRQVVNDA